MMERTAHGVADDEALAERAAVVRARGADREDLPARPREQDGLALRMPHQGLAFGELGDGDALREIGTAQFVSTCHGVLRRTEGLSFHGRGPWRSFRLGLCCGGGGIFMEPLTRRELLSQSTVLLLLVPAVACGSSSSGGSSAADASPG